MRVEVSAKAYTTLLLHALKYPHAAVNGLLVGGAQVTSVTVEEAVPLLHSGLELAPMLEAALAQAEAHYAAKGMKVVGYYHANERHADNELGGAARAVLLVDSVALGESLGQGGAGKVAVRLCSREGAKWKAREGDERLQVAPTAPKLLAGYYAERRHRQVVDFDDHLEDVGRDWLNNGDRLCA